MRASFTASFANAGLMGSALAVLTLDIARGPQFYGEIDARQLRSRAIIPSTLFNNITQGSYYVEVQVGTPPQKQTLFLDTGSSDVWILDSTADLCTTPRLQQRLRGGCATTFQPSKSTTYEVAVKNGFNITYLDGTSAIGDYIQETFAIGGATITNLEMGLARKATLGSGIMGIGYSTNVASESPHNVLPPFIYPNFMDTILSEGLVNRKAYSLYLNDLSASTGSIIFGGMDSAKYHGNLLELPVLSSKYTNGTTVFAELAVALTSVAITGQTGNVANLTTVNFKEPVLLDSGTTFSYLPYQLVASIYKALNAVDDTGRTGLVFIDCAILNQSPKLTLDYGFGGANGITINVPVDELAFDLYTRFNITENDLPELPFANTCGFGIFANSDSDSDNDVSLLGDNFLRSAYVVYDLQANQIAIGQTNFNSTTSSIIEFQASATGIPLVSGVASSAAVTQTAIAGFPGVGAKTTTAQTVISSPSGTGSKTTTGSGTTATTAASSSKSAAMGQVPVADVRLFAVLGLSGILAIFGGGWFAL